MILVNKILWKKTNFKVYVVFTNYETIVTTTTVDLYVKYFYYMHVQAVPKISLKDFFKD